MRERKALRQTFVQIRGDFLRKGKKVTREYFGSGDAARLASALDNANTALACGAAYFLSSFFTASAS